MGLDANFDAMNAYDEQLEGLELMNWKHWLWIFFSVLDVFFFYCIWQHLWIPSLDTPSLEIGELQAIRDRQLTVLVLPFEA